jgi:hypothetical protein
LTLSRRFPHRWIPSPIEFEDNETEEVRDHKVRYFLQGPATGATASTIVPRGTI